MVDAQSSEDRLKAALANRYKLEREIGSGGMATVYLAQDLKHHRNVAVKVLKPELAAVMGTERFLAEIRTTANLTHPHILPLHDSGETDGFLFYVMPYVEGESLRDRMNQEQELGVEEALRITGQVASALHYAHSKGILHRDIKPENILLQADQVVVADFGIALALDSAGGARLTETGLSIGTPAYMSPEQVVGERELDARSDIYSLGCVLYEMLAGDPPFTASNPRAVLAKHLTDPAPPVTTVRPGVSAAVATAIAVALEKAPADRYQSARAFDEALYAEPADVEAEKKSIAVLPFENLSADPDQEYFCDGMTEEIINALSHVEDLKVIARTSAFAFKGRHEDVREIGRALDVGHLLEGSVRKAGNRLRITAQLVQADDGSHVWSDRYDRNMDDVFAVQDEIARSIASTLRLRLLGGPGQSLVRAGTESSEAYDLYLKGRHRWVRRYRYGLDAALEYFERAVAKDPEYALPYTGIADTHSIFAIYGLLDTAEARRVADESAQRAMALDPNLPEAHFSRGVIQGCFDYDWDGSEHSLQLAVELNPEFASAHGWLGMVKALLGRHLDEAFDHAETACALDPDTPYIQGIAGLANIMGRRYPEAIEHFERALELEPEDILALYGSGTCYSALGRHGDAIGTLKKAVALSERMAWYMGLLCSAYRRAGRTADAQAVHRELLERAAHQYVPPVAMAITCANVGLPEDALLYLEQSLADAKPSLTNLVRYPIWDAILSHPRYIAVVTGMGGEPWDLS